MNIRVDLNTPIKGGTEVVFRSPVDCSKVTGLIVYCTDNGNTTAHEFAFADAHGNNVGDVDHLFAENVVVKVILDPETNMAFVQNADTNAYLEWRFKDTIDKCCPSFTESGSMVTCEPVEGYPLEVEWQRKNLLDKSKIEIGGIVGITGNNWETDTAMRTDYIPVSPMQSYITSGNSFEIRRIYAYDKNKAWISQLTVGKLPIIETVENTAYVRIVFGDGVTNYTESDLTLLKDAPIQLEVGTTATAYEPYAETATITRCGKNLLDGNAMADVIASNGGTKDESAGTITFHPRTLTSEKLPLFTSFKPNIQYTIIMKGTGSSNHSNLCIQYTDGTVQAVSSFDATGYCRLVTDATKQVKALTTYYSSGSTTLNYIECGIFVGDVSIADFEPYREPETFAVGEPITAIQGVNTLYADAGLVTVKGKADPVAIINKLTNAILSLGSNV